jgi:RNA polymerase sigma-70 factor (sigma-E family)
MTAMFGARQRVVPVAARSALPADVADARRRETLAEMHREHYAHLVRLACLLVDRVDVAEEIVQEAFVRLHGSLDRIEDPADRPAYLRSIVMNLARSRLRRRQVVDRHPPLPSPDGAPADADVVLREDQREVIAALRTLPERQRACLVLRYYGELSEAEIAATLGISAGSVKTHVSRAMAAMTKQLEARR